jgi:hypothetical protein
VNRKAQYSIIAAILVSAVLITTFIVTYSMIRENPIADQPQTMNAVDETNFAIKQILGFTVGYYGSVLEVTGNTTDAYSRTVAYVQDGLTQVAGLHPEWGTSLSLVPPIQISTYWYCNESYSIGQMTVSYNLTKLGVSGITYQPICKLDVQVRNATGGKAYLNVTQDDSGPTLDLHSQNFMFFNYTTASTWVQVNPITEPTFVNGTYLVDIPQGIDQQSFVVKVQDSRGIEAIASSINQYTIVPIWNSTYTPTSDATVVVELLQNGTMRWLGQNLQVAQGNHTQPIPPIPVKAIMVNETINSINQQVPFQVEDWASQYEVPLALTSNASLLNCRTMIVFLINSNVSRATVWWNGSDQVIQTSFAIYDSATSPFRNDNVTNRFLSNGLLNITIPWANNHISVISQIGKMNSTTQFMRVNTMQDMYGDDVSWVISHGIVRDIVHAEPEWQNSTQQGAPNCPDFYAHVVITLPANATYFTYTSTMIFLNSSQPKRNLSDLCVINVNSTGLTNRYPLTENGTQLNSTNTGLFYNYSASVWAHHWSQIANSSGPNPTAGAGIMFNDQTNTQMYYFDNQTSKTGGLDVIPTSNVTELDPVKQYQTMDFHAQPFEITWTCAVVTFYNTTPICKDSASGLWIIVEYPPTLAITAKS